MLYMRHMFKLFGRRESIITSSRLLEMQGSYGIYILMEAFNNRATLCPG